MNTLKVYLRLLSEILALGAIAILMAYATVGMIEPPRPSAYFGLPASAPTPDDQPAKVDA